MISIEVATVSWHCCPRDWVVWRDLLSPGWPPELNLLPTSFKSFDNAKLCYVQRERRAAATLRYRTRLKRLHHALNRAKAAASTTMQKAAATIQVITQGMETMSLDAGERLQRIRRQLIAVKMAGAASCRRRRFASYAGPHHLTARAFYKRISVKFSNRSASSLPVVPGSQLSVADRLAADWRPIIQQQPQDEALQDAFFHSIPARGTQSDFAGLAGAISVEEVADAIKSCPRGKASGPDGLPNDWYRELSDDVASVLAPLFTMWYDAGVLPVSFKSATIFCIPKTNRPASGLDYRPIALLNSDYKIYARVLLNRIRSQVVHLVPTTQFGFVAGRQVHDAIDVWTAVQTLVRQGRAPESTMAVMLDFAKAYDTLDRRFLRLALNHLGFPARFTEAVDAMHLATTAQYLTEGQLSDAEDIRAGIRQGCPLAPTLFIVAVSVLYEAVDANPILTGVELAEGVRITLVGFADDTTAYVTTTEEAAEPRRVLAAFGDASGLRVNQSKSRAVSARASGIVSGFHVGFPVLGIDEIFRYLGAMIASHKSAKAVWDVAIRQLTARLHLAAIKTSNLLQRIQVCKVIIVPKLLFVARHCWPNGEQAIRLQKFIHDYTWLGTTSPDTRARMDEQGRCSCAAQRRRA